LRNLAFVVAASAVLANALITVTALSAAIGVVRVYQNDDAATKMIRRGVASDLSMATAKRSKWTSRSP
jgi:hypothetical protein